MITPDKYTTHLTLYSYYCIKLFFSEYMVCTSFRCITREVELPSYKICFFSALITIWKSSLLSSYSNFLPIFSNGLLPFTLLMFHSEWKEVLTLYSSIIYFFTTMDNQLFVSNLKNRCLYEGHENSLCLLLEALLNFTFRSAFHLELTFVYVCCQALKRPPQNLLIKGTKFSRSTFGINRRNLWGFRIWT